MALMKVIVRKMVSFKPYKPSETITTFFIDIGANNGTFIDRLNTAKLTKKGPIKICFSIWAKAKPEGGLGKKIVRGELIQSALSNKKDKATFNICPSDDTVLSLFNRVDTMPHVVSKLTQIEVNLDRLDSYLPWLSESHRKEYL